MTKIRKWFLMSLTLGFILVGPSKAYSQVETEKTQETSYLQKHIPRDLEGCGDTIMLAILYPFFYMAGVEGVLIFIPSKYPNGEVRSHGG